MPLRNSIQHYGWISIALHWIMAITLIAQYFVGGYMVDLTYYDSLYHTLPYWHKGVGLLLGLMLAMRIAWLYSHPKPAPIGHPGLQHLLARLGHWGLYGLVVVLLISGYLISTAKAKGIDVFGLFELPALLGEDEQRGELAGKVHEVAATLFMLLVGVHALAAFLHHFYWKDNTLTRMLGLKHQTGTN